MANIVESSIINTPYMLLLNGKSSEKGARVMDGRDMLEMAGRPMAALGLGPVEQLGKQERRHLGS